MALRPSSRCAAGIRATASMRRGPSSPLPTTPRFTYSPMSSTSRRNPRARRAAERHDEVYTLATSRVSWRAPTASPGQHSAACENATKDVDLCASSKCPEC